jgi:hypothetical protein
MLDSIELTLKDISSNMERVIRDREENLTKITDQRRKIHSEIQEERRKINAHLDKLEEQIIANLDAEEAKIKSFIIWACLSFSPFILIAGGFVFLHTEPKISLLFIATIFAAGR